MSELKLNSLLSWWLNVGLLLSTEIHYTIRIKNVIITIEIISKGAFITCISWNKAQKHDYNCDR